MIVGPDISLLDSSSINLGAVVIINACSSGRLTGGPCCVQKRLRTLLSKLPASAPVILSHYVDTIKDNCSYLKKKREQRKKLGLRLLF